MKMVARRTAIGARLCEAPGRRGSATWAPRVWWKSHGPKAATGHTLHDTLVYACKQWPSCVSEIPTHASVTGNGTTSELHCVGHTPMQPDASLVNCSTLCESVVRALFCASIPLVQCHSAWTDTLGQRNAGVNRGVRRLVRAELTSESPFRAA